MYGRLRRWSRTKRTAVLVGLALSSAVVRYGVRGLTDSGPAHLIIDGVLIIVLAWIGVTYFRVLLRESEEDARRNPRPW